MAKLYALDLQPCLSGNWRRILPKLPRERQRRALACRFEADSARITGSGWLLQYALEQAGLPAPQQIFSETPWGKPHLADREDLHFSLSHSGSWVVCAVSDTPVGVDIELPRCTLSVARRHFQPEEIAGLELLPHMAQTDALNRIWTAKEAFLKALGRGVTVPLGSFTVTLGETGAVLKQDLSPLPFRLHEYPMDAYRICLCTADDRPQLQQVTAE